MSVVCGICDEQPSKYRCPHCSLRYCSITCYKEHKLEHPEVIAAADTTAQSTKGTPGILPSSGPRPARPKKADFSPLATDALLQDLLKKDPRLRLQLQAVYGHTLEPAPGSRRNFSAGRYPGNGEASIHLQHGPWTQAKGDAEALQRLKAMRDADENGSVAEFIKLVGMRLSGNGDEARQQGA